MAKNHTPTEYAEQCQVIAWSRMMAATTEPRLALLHGDASGVRVGIGAALKMRKAGAVKGWPDLFLPVTYKYEPAGHPVSYGLFIELKRRRGGVVSPEQRTVHSMLQEQGYRVEVCKGADEAIKVISEYLGIH